MAYRIEGETGAWEVVIGLEVHAQIVSEAKLFSGAPTAFGAAPNAQVSLVDAAMPGMLPVVNERCVRQAARAGLALDAEIARVSVFERKNYFYPDLPQGYQISQYKRPIVGEGHLDIDAGEGRRRIGVERLHLEQDAGKSLHDRHPAKSYIDLNRAGVALMEIVSRPDLRSPEEAGAYLRELRSILRHIGACDGNMQEGSLRCDANVSVRRPGGDLGVRTEIKNLNSIRFLQQAIAWEARRQVEVIEGGGTVAQETRLFDAARGETRPMRSKEDAHDYRYFPDPDLAPLELSDAWIAEVAAGLPELPAAKRARYAGEHGIGAEEAARLAEEPETAAFYEALAAGRDPRPAANWLLGDLSGALNKAGLGLADSPVGAAALGGLLDLLADGAISGRIAKDVFAEMFETGRGAAEIVEAKGLRQVSDAGAIAGVVDAVLAEHADKAAEYRAGKTKLLGFFVGQTMKRTAGQANPRAVNEALRARLDGG